MLYNFLRFDVPSAISKQMPQTSLSSTWRRAKSSRQRFASRGKEQKKAPGSVFPAGARSSKHERPRAFRAGFVGKRRRWSGGRGRCCLDNTALALPVCSFARPGQLYFLDWAVFVFSVSKLSFGRCANMRTLHAFPRLAGRLRQFWRFACRSCQRRRQPRKGAANASSRVHSAHG